MAVVKCPKNDVQALQAECNMLENIVNDLQKNVKVLQSICEMHQMVLKALRQETVGLRQDQGLLNLMWQDETLEFLQ